MYKIMNRIHSKALYLVAASCNKGTNKCSVKMLKGVITKCQSVTNNENNDHWKVCKMFKRNTCKYTMYLSLMYSSLMFTLCFSCTEFLSLGNNVILHGAIEVSNNHPYESVHPNLRSTSKNHTFFTIF